MNLFAAVVERLRQLGAPCALVGAEALAIRGASRATLDRDLLTTDRRTLDAGTWSALEQSGYEAEIRRGDADDPLAGVVRFRGSGERPVDLVVGRQSWQARIVDRAEPFDLGEARIAVARASDLILLKLYAGGPQDAWDILQLLDGEVRAELISEVEALLGDLPVEARRLWARIRES